MDHLSLDAHTLSVSRSLSRCFAPWSKIPPEVWAEEVYRLPGGRRFRWSYAPYSRQMFRSLFDRQTRETVLQVFSRGLKSTVILLATGYFCDQAPRRKLFMWPTTGQAEKFSKDNLDGELFATTPPLQYMSSQAGKRNAATTILHKTGRGFTITIFGANAPGELRRAKGSFLAADEIDAYEVVVSDEGDILEIFKKRGSEYPDTIFVTSSYPSLVGHSRVQARLDGSDCNRWYSTCVRCGGEPYVMHRNHLRYDDPRPQDARMECPRCHELLTDRERFEMAHRQGFDCWKADREFSGRRGFHAGAMLWPHPVDEHKYPGGFLQIMAQQELDAKASENPRRSLRVLVNTVDAEPFDPLDESEQPPDWKVIAERRESYGLTVPDGGLYLTAFVDVQLNRLEVEWKAWGRHDESWGMDHVTIEGYVRDPEVWATLRTELARRWKHTSGAEMRLGFSFVDGGHYAEDVYRFMRDLAANPKEGVTGHCRASKGVGKHGHPIIDRKYRTVAKTLKGYHIGTWEAKDLIYGRLKSNEDEGKMHFNERYSNEFFQQLTVERVAISFDGGQEIRKFENEKNERNEGLDLGVGNLAAWRLHPRNLDMLEEKIREAAKLSRGEKKPVQKMQPSANPVLQGLNAW